MTAGPTQRARSIISFLRGEGPIDGNWFGEKPADAKGNFWWRKYLTEIEAALKLQVGSPHEHAVPASAAAAEQSVQPGMSDPAGCGLLTGAERYSGPDDRARSEGAWERTDHESGDRSRGPGASRDLVALTREAEVRGEERAAIVAWLRQTADDLDARAEKTSNALQRERLSGSAFTERFRAKQIENGRHHMSRDEYRQRFFPAIRGDGMGEGRDG